MSLRLQLQDSQGSGCRIDARALSLSVSQGVVQLGQGSHLSFVSGELEVIQNEDSRYFGMGEGFASVSEDGLSLVTDRYLEVLSSEELRALPASESAPVCVVCEKRLTDTLHSITVNETLVRLCCPHCVETFRRAARIVRQSYPAETTE